MVILVASECRGLDSLAWEGPTVLMFPFLWFFSTMNSCSMLRVRCCRSDLVMFHQGGAGGQAASLQA